MKHIRTKLYLISRIIIYKLLYINLNFQFIKIKYFNIFSPFIAQNILKWMYKTLFFIAVGISNKANKVRAINFKDFIYLRTLWVTQYHNNNNDSMLYIQHVRQKWENSLIALHKRSPMLTIKLMMRIWKPISITIYSQQYSDGKHFMVCLNSNIDLFQQQNKNNRLV